MEDKTTLGKFIRTKRKEKGLSQKEFANMLYVTESAVSKWERGVSYPDITLVSGICNALNITEHELCIASEDYKQRETERMAKKYVKTIRTYNFICLGVYLAILIPCFIGLVIADHDIRQFLMWLTSLAMTASLINVPTLVKKHKGVITLGCFYVTLHLLLLTGFGLEDINGFIMAFLSVTFAFTLIFLPIILCREDFGKCLTGYRGLICMAADTILLLVLIAYGSYNSGSSTDYTIKSVILPVLFILTVPWVFFAVIRYAGLNGFFKTSICIAYSAILLFFTEDFLARYGIQGYVMYINGRSYKNETVLIILITAAIFSAVGAAFSAIKKRSAGTEQNV
ncbi:MAG: helix-turn-helix transcriptional regulator [Ruminococcus sp.]|nr:helix-turn-helix transcriptional regulator [Ruminococcus sp.]